MKTKQKTRKTTPIKAHVQRHLKLAFVPHKANQYRPHATRRYGLAVLLLLIIGLQVSYNVGTTGSVLGIEENISSVDLLGDTNARRAEAQLQPLQVSDELNRAAFLKAQDMLQRQYWAHAAPDGTQPWKWLGDVGYNYSHAGENLAKNFRSADAVTTAWMDSPEHRANVLSTNYHEVGFAVVDGTMDGKPISLVVAMYASKATPAVAGVKADFTPAQAQPVGFVSQLGLAVKSLTPAALGSIILLIMATVVALTAHAYRNKLPKVFKKSWRLHHGAYKAAGLMSLMMVIVAIYSGGQI
ncbi:MAG TPA: CAP domain-containing protein [Candidatus Saccharimonadales bacterium]